LKLVAAAIRSVAESAPWTRIESSVAAVVPPWASTRHTASKRSAPLMPLRIAVRAAHDESIAHLRADHGLLWRLHRRLEADATQTVRRETHDDHLVQGLEKTPA